MKRKQVIAVARLNTEELPDAEQAQEELEVALPGTMGLGGFVGCLVRYLHPYHWRVLLIFLGLLLEMSFTAAIPVGFKYLIDIALVERNQEVLITIVAGLGLGAVVVSIAGLGRDYLYAQMATRILHDIRQQMFDHLQRLSIGFYQRMQTGDILARFSVDLSSVENALTTAIPWAILPALEALLSTVLLFLLDWRLALVAMLAWSLSLVGPRVFASRALTASRLRKEKEAKALSAVQENVMAQMVVKALGLEAIWLQLFRQHNHELHQSSVKVNFLSALVERSATIGIDLLQVLVLVVGGFMAYAGLVSVGTLAAFQALLLTLSCALSYVTQYLPTLVQAASGMRRIEELLDERPRVQDSPSATVLPRLAHEIRFKGVTFGYTPGQINLRNVDLVIKQGWTVAFVGPSGSGKSTLLNLILRFYDPDCGSVSFDGCDLRTVTRESLRCQIGVVFQESLLFNTTILENVRLGRPTATDLEVQEACELAEIHDFILSLPQGYHTFAGERGSRFSGGQRQRLGIARAILRKPAILILDEATSALDPATEAAINATVQRIAKNMTVISVTHRLEAASWADRIFVVEHGCIIEQGSHDELLWKNGLHSHLWRRQALKLMKAYQGGTAHALN